MHQLRKGAGGPTWSGLKPRSRLKQGKRSNSHGRDSPTPARPVDAESVRSGLAALAPVLIEIEMPTGVMRLPLDSNPEIAAARAKVDVCRDFIANELPAAAKDVGEKVAGPTFQALLVHGYRDQAVDSTGPVVAAAPCDAAAARQKKCSISMYAVREDRAAGASIDLYGNFDIILDQISRIFQLHACTMLYFVPMPIGC